MDVGLLRQYAAEGLTRIAIAQKMGMSYSRTTTALRENGINVKRKKHDAPKRGPKPQTVAILELRQKGMKQKQIAEILGCCLNTVKSACRKNGLSLEQNPISESEATEMISRAGYDYVSGFVNAHSKVTVRCRECGCLSEKMYHNLYEQANGTYKYKMQCPHCYRKEVKANGEKKREEKRELKEREAQMKAQRKAEQLSREANEQLAMRLAIHVCKNCGTEYCIEITGYNSNDYCSKRCQQRWHERIKNEKRMNKLKARPHDTDITLEKLFKRDGGVCYICGNACDWSDIVEQDGTKIAGGRYPSIDHVKPVSKGGTHTWDNIKLACRSCNSLKGWK